MASLLLCLLLLPAPAALPDAGAVPRPLIRAVDLDADALQADPALLAADTLALVVKSSREAFYKLSERGAVLASGRLLPGSNTVRVARPGLTAGSQSLFFVLDLLEQDVPAQKFLRVQVTLADTPGTQPGEPTGLSGSFRVEMYHSGQLFGFRKKSMADLLKLKTGPVMPVPDPALSGAAGRSPSTGQSISVLGVGMAIAKFLAGKKAKKKLQAHAAEMQKKRLAMTLQRGQQKIPIVIELRVE